MELTQAEQEAIRQWVEQGKSLSDIQKGLETEFNRTLTYMEVRFLVDDLDLELKENKKKKADKEKKTEASDDLGAGKPGITMDKVVRPGAAMSGDITFSSGKSAEWLIDAFGQPKLMPKDKKHKPSKKEIVEFQEQLSSMLQSQGF